MPAGQLMYWTYYSSFIYGLPFLTSFSALTLLVGHQEECLACKN